MNINVCCWWLDIMHVLIHPFNILYDICIRYAYEIRKFLKHVVNQPERIFFWITKVHVCTCTSNMLWNHHFSWETNVRGFVGNPCQWIYIPASSISLIFIKIIPYFLPTKCHYEPGKFLVTQNIDPPQIKMIPQ